MFKSRFGNSKCIIHWVCIVACLLVICLSIYRFTDNQRQDLIIIKNEGGICSQIVLCGLGHALSKKGYKVKYDLSWFRENGKDLDGVFARNYELPRAFPTLKFEEAMGEEVKLYSERYASHIGQVNKCHPPMYINCYPHFSSLIKYRNFFIENFTPVELDKIEDILDNIRGSNACAVHVRRGDLAKHCTSLCYGYPCSVNYFLKAIKIITSLCDKPKFFFFSDEPGWIKDNIVPKLDKNVDYHICEKNGSDAGYLDLYLMTQCKHIISSKGSFGVYARILSKNNGYFIAPMNRIKISEFFDNCIFLSDHEVNESK